MYNPNICYMCIIYNFMVFFYIKVLESPTQLREVRGMRLNEIWWRCPKYTDITPGNYCTLVVCDGKVASVMSEDHRCVPTWTASRATTNSVFQPKVSLWVPTWPGSKQQAHPQAPGLRNSTPKTRDRMEEDGTCTCLQPIRSTVSTVDES